METKLFWKYTDLLQRSSGDCKSRRMADTPQEQLGDLGMVLGSSVNRTLSAWNTSHLGWFLNPTRQNSCSMASTALQQAWNTKKIPGWSKVFPLLPSYGTPGAAGKNNLRYLPCKRSKQLCIRSFPAVWAECVGFLIPKDVEVAVGEQEEIVDFKGGSPTWGQTRSSRGLTAQELFCSQMNLSYLFLPLRMIVELLQC